MNRWFRTRRQRVLAAIAAIGLLGGATELASASAEAFDPAAVDRAARALPRLRSLLVSQRGRVLFERYYGGAGAEKPTNVKSASKSVISTLVGIAIEHGLIPGVETPIARYFPELVRDPDPRKREITVGHLLAMRPGLEGTSGRSYGAWVLSRNWVRHALARPMFADPGDAMEYSTGNSHLLSAILTSATGMSTWQFANDALAKPLGFTLAQWPRDPQGIYFGGNEMLMTPKQMLTFGELYLNEGRHAGRQIVPERWVARSCEGRARVFRADRRPAWFGLDPTRDRRYGLGWWVHDIAGHDSCFAGGYGGQYLWVRPELDLVIVTTAPPDVSEERRDHRRLLFDVVSRLIVEPLAREHAGPV